MKKLLVALVVVISIGACKFKAPEESSEVLIDNDKVRVTEYTGDPKGAVCGSGLHKHGPHVTILLTDAEVLDTKDGKAQKKKLYKGLVFWSEGGTHTAINIGKSTV